jgi:sensor histidine kinase YesM
VHTILANRRRSALYVAAWIPIGALLIGIVARGGGMSLTEAAVILIPMVGLYAFICQSSWYLCSAVPLRESGLLRLCATHATAAAVSAGVWIGIGWLWSWTLDSSQYFDGIQQRYLAEIPILIFSGLLLFVLAVVLNYLLITFETSQRVEKTALELEILAREAELKALRAQIDPHFLFNSLNSISSLVTADPAGARRMCILLAEFFRGAMKFGSERTIALSEELRLAECYLDIERVRLGARLRVEREVERECEACLVPPLIMQPLVENAITHGIAPMLEGGLVRVQATRNGAGLKIVVENPFEPENAAKTGSGVGLRNVRMRLMNLYDGDARMDVAQTDGRFHVELQMPCHQV